MIVPHRCEEKIHHLDWIVATTGEGGVIQGPLLHSQWISIYVAALFLILYAPPLNDQLSRVHIPHSQ